MRIAAVPLLLLGAPLASAVDWNVRSISVIDRNAAGEKAKLTIAANGVTLERRDRSRIAVPVESISEVIYRPGRYSRGGAVLQDNSPAGDPVQTLVALAGLGMIGSKATNHYIVLSWTESGEAKQEIFEAGKKDYRSILSALEALTGKPAIDGAVATAVTGAPLVHWFDAGGGWRIPLRRMMVGGEPAVCFPAQHQHSLMGRRLECAGWLCVGAREAEFRPGAGGKEDHGFRAALADLAPQRPAKQEYYLTLRTPKKWDFALISQRGASAHAETSKKAAEEAWTLFWRAVTEFPAVESELMLRK